MFSRTLLFGSLWQTFLRAGDPSLIDRHQGRSSYTGGLRALRCAGPRRAPPMHGGLLGVDHVLCKQTAPLRRPCAAQGSRSARAVLHKRPSTCLRRPAPAGARSIASARTRSWHHDAPDLCSAVPLSSREAACVSRAREPRRVPVLCSARARELQQQQQQQHAARARGALGRGLDRPRVGARAAVSGAHERASRARGAARGAGPRALARIVLCSHTGPALRALHGQTADRVLWTSQRRHRGGMARAGAGAAGRGHGGSRAVSAARAVGAGAAAADASAGGGPARAEPAGVLPRVQGVCELQGAPGRVPAARGAGGREFRAVRAVRAGGAGGGRAGGGRAGRAGRARGARRAGTHARAARPALSQFPPAARPQRIISVYPDAKIHPDSGKPARLPHPHTIRMQPPKKKALFPNAIASRFFLSSSPRPAHSHCSLSLGARASLSLWRCPLTSAPPMPFSPHCPSLRSWLFPLYKQMLVVYLSLHIVLYFLLSLSLSLVHSH